MVKFRVSPKMNKLEMKEWIETAYDTPVKKVNTANYEGKIVRRSGGKGPKFSMRMGRRPLKRVCARRRAAHPCVRVSVRVMRMRDNASVLVVRLAQGGGGRSLVSPQFCALGNSRRGGAWVRARRSARARVGLSSVIAACSPLCALRPLVRLASRAGYYKRPDYKVAFVYLENPWTVPKE